MMLTLRPRLSSRQPIEAAASPLPNDETTPPVTKMYLAGMPAPLVYEMCGVLVDVLQLFSFSLETGNSKLETVFRGCCAPGWIGFVGLAPAGVHDLLYRNSGPPDQILLRRKFRYLGSGV